MFFGSSLIHCGDDLHSNNLLLSPSILLFWRSFHSGAWWESVGSASLIFFRIPMISPPLVRIPITLNISEHTRPEPEDSWIGKCLNFHHFDTQSRNQEIWLPSKRFTVTPAVCPRLFEILTTLKFGALRKDHIVSTACEDITKKRKRQKQRKPVVHVLSAVHHVPSRTQPKFGRESCVSRQWLLHRTKGHLLPQVIYLHYGTYYFEKHLVRKKNSGCVFFLVPKQKTCNCDHFDRDGASVSPIDLGLRTKALCYHEASL